MIVVHRPDRDFLFRIRAGESTFEDLMSQVEAKLAAIETIHAQSDLPETPKSLQNLRKTNCSFLPNSSKERRAQESHYRKGF